MGTAAQVASVHLTLGGAALVPDKFRRLHANDVFDVVVFG